MPEWGEYCEWPNPARSAASRAAVTPLPSLEARRAAWAALDDRRQSPLVPPRIDRRRVGRPRKAESRYHPEILPSGRPRPSSTGWRSTAGAEVLVPGNVVFWEGPSLLTGEPIQAIAGRLTINAKTGLMVQVWILRADMDPIQAVKTGGDTAICGDCKLRGDRGIDRACYVQWFRAPR